MGGKIQMEKCGLKNSKDEEVVKQSVGWDRSDTSVDGEPSDCEFSGLPQKDKGDGQMGEES